MYMGGTIFYGYTAFFVPIAEDFGWSYAQLSLAISLRGMETSLFAPLVGHIADRVGPRKMVFTGVTIAAVGFFILSRTTSLPMFYASILVTMVGMSLAGMTMMMAVIAKWFDRYVGLATGLVVSGLACGGLMIPVITFLIEDFGGWRNAAEYCAIGMLVLLPLSLLLRKPPVMYHSLPERAASREKTDVDIYDGGNESPKVKKGLRDNFRLAMGSRAFWVLVIAYIGFAVLISSMIGHVMPFLDSIGIDEHTASLYAMTIPLLSIVGRIGIGWLSDKFDRRIIAVICFTMMGIGMLCFALATVMDVRFIWLTMGIFSIGYGGGTTVRAGLIRDFFDRTNFGSVFGLLIAITTIGTIISPTLVGWMYDQQQSYTLIWFIYAGVGLLSAMVIRFGRLPG